MDCEMERLAVEHKEKWREVIEDIPFIRFQSDWDVKVIPPFGGAMARFVVYKNNKFVSVYYDTMSRLGIMNAPYYEAYPIDDDARRYSPDDIDQMMADIAKELG